jgi:hypothetical protein
MPIKTQWAENEVIREAHKYYSTASLTREGILKNILPPF